MRDVSHFAGLLGRLEPERALVAEPPREGAKQDSVRGLEKEALRKRMIAAAAPLSAELSTVAAACALWNDVHFAALVVLAF